MIVPTEELRKRLKKNLIRDRSGEHQELTLWMMDGTLYDTSSMGAEAERYYQSKGFGERMISGTIWNYTPFWNKWILGSRE